MEELLSRGLLLARTMVEVWWLPDVHDSPAPPAGYVVSFTVFHKWGFASPPHQFLCGLLDYYKIELHHLNQNGIQHQASFVVLCEGYLGISPHFDLCRHFFAINLLKVKWKDGELDRFQPRGCTGIHLRNNWVKEYMTLNLVSSNKGWHSLWFYLKDSPVPPLPAFSCHGIFEAPAEWKDDVPTVDLEKIDHHLATINFLKASGPKGVRVIRAYYWRSLTHIFNCQL
jgi:hypothetical protein